MLQQWLLLIPFLLPFSSGHQVPAESAEHGGLLPSCLQISVVHFVAAVAAVEAEAVTVVKLHHWLEECAP